MQIRIRDIARGAMALCPLLGGACVDSAVPQPGEVRVTVTTTGANLPNAGYSIAVGFQPTVSVAINGSATVGAPAGRYSVLLGGIPANCTTGTNPMIVTVPGGGTVQVTFAVSCT